VNLIRVRQIAFLAISTLFIGGFLVGFGPIQSNAGKNGTHASPSPSFEYDSNMLLKEFRQAQEEQMRTAQARERAAFKELRNTQASQQKAFDLHEKEERQKFFAAEHQGTEKRAYMKALLERRDAYRKNLADDRAKLKTESDNRILSLSEEQKDNLEKFKDALSKNQRPADSLWPQPSL
jgi:hypothetical protein